MNMNRHNNPVQCARLLERLKRGPVTPLEAWQELGIYRLSARVYELRQAGHKIETGSVDVVTSFDETIRVAEYRLGGGV